MDGLSLVQGVHGGGDELESLLRCDVLLCCSTCHGCEHAEERVMSWHLLHHDFVHVMHSLGSVLCLVLRMSAG